MAIAVGVWLGPKLDSGRLFEADYRESEKTTRRRSWDRYGLPLLIGVVLGAILLVSLSRLDVSGSKGKDITAPNAWEGLLASVGAGIREEIWLRFGLLTLFVWLGVLVMRASSRIGANFACRLLVGQCGRCPELRRHSHSASVCAFGLKCRSAFGCLRRQRHTRARLRLALLAPGANPSHARALRARPGSQGGRPAVFAVARAAAGTRSLVGRGQRYLSDV